MEQQIPDGCGSLSVGRGAYLLASFVLTTAFVEADPVITDVSITATQVMVTFEEDGPNNQFEIERNPSLLAVNWSTDDSAVLAPQGGGVFTYTLSRNAADQEFFRVIGSFFGTGIDPDGDGLPSTLEDDFATNSNSPNFSDSTDFDTDNDGFSDGVEFANGTEINNPADFPVFLGVPAVQFAEANSSFVEGSSSTHEIELVLDQPYSGTITYSVNSRSTATTPADYGSLSGTVSVNGTTATLSIPVVDDMIVQQEQKILAITLDSVPSSSGYRLAGGSLHVVCLCDNDAFWSASLKDDIFERDFRLKVLKQGSTTEVVMVAGSSDGLPIVDGGTSSQSTGLVPTSPQEEWPASFTFDSTSQFAFVSQELPVPVSTFGGFNGSSARVTEEPLIRVITFNCEANNPDHVFQDGVQYIGDSLETISAVDPSKTYLTRQTSGLMVMIREIQSPPNLSNPLDPRLP
jgi:hypothetical protein